MVKTANKINKNNGFALIELLVSVTLFIIISTIVAGAVSNLFINNRLSKSNELLSSNLELIIEDISRNARVGKNFYCGAAGDNKLTRDCVNPSSIFSFTTEYGERVTYDYDVGGKTLYKKVGNNQSIKLSNIPITFFKVWVQGSSKSDLLQPQATILVSGQVVQGTYSKNLTLQTSVTQRVIDSLN